MGNKGKKHIKIRNKNDLPVFDSDDDLLKAFKKEHQENESRDRQLTEPLKEVETNKHGVKVLNDLSDTNLFKEEEGDEDFSQLLEDSFKKKNKKSTKKTSSPMPVKKRLKRYPPPETELDLHGYTAIGAQVKTKSFITGCKHQGFFTVRIIVGKGLHSELGPVLPDVVEDVLKELKKQNQVLAYEWEKKKKARSGAVIVFIKQFQEFD